ncbi:uncharacterized protein, partial [Garra rufa]|uniref:uncharacterized protein n=1 Tax=Garra rufa TaxID=137080 RepID=UPI003CCEA3E8
MANINQECSQENRTPQHQIHRSFPGYFRPNIKRGKKRSITVSKLSKQASKTFSFNFYLLPKNTSVTPLSNEELELLQAGLGRRTVSVPEDGDHSEISRILKETFPKMEGLCGGWLLHKATGGCGRRKLIVIPPEAEGYSAKNLKSVSSGGKAIFYVVPLQDSLDTSPLAPDSPHFSKMPKTTCYQCSEVMPLQMLAVHIKTCIGKLSSDDDREDQISDVWVVEDKSKVACPICYREFLKDDITIHASVCGESLPTESSVTTCADEGFPVHTSACTPKSLEDVLTFLKEQVDTTKEFKLCVNREDLPERGIIQWKRKKTASPASLLKVEDAADTESLMMLADDIVSCGYTSQIKHELKESIIRSIVLHSTTRLIPILQQLKNGMQLYGLVDQLNKNSEVCKPLFVPGKITPDADFIMMNCQPRYSEKGTSKEASERKVTNFLQDFLQELEVAGDGVLGETRPLSVPMVLQWMTGQSHIPILPDEKRRFKITCNFDHDCMERLNHSVCYPIVSACTCTVTFPVKHMS